MLAHGEGTRVTHDLVIEQVGMGDPEHGTPRWRNHQALWGAINGSPAHFAC